MVLPFFVEAGLLLARLCWLEMYSRKFGLRLQGKFENLLKTADYPDVTDYGTVAADWVICGTRIRSRFYVNESWFRLTAETSRLAACAPQRGKPAKGFGVTAAAAERPPFSLLRLSAGCLGCGNSLVEALIAAQRIPARIETEIAVGWTLLE